MRNVRNFRGVTQLHCLDSEDQSVPIRLKLGFQRADIVARVLNRVMQALYALMPGHIVTSVR